MQSQAIEHPEITDVEVCKAFQTRMMQNALLQRAGGELDILHVSRFQVLDLPLHMVPPPMPCTLADILQDPRHADRTVALEGPLLFMQENGNPVVIEPAGLLLRPEDDIRRAALHYLARGASSDQPWLTPHTSAVIKERASDIESADSGRWRPAGIEILPLVRDDRYAHLAGLRQCIAARFEEGIREYVAKVLRPTFQTLAHLRPPTWSTREQRNEFNEWIDQCAKFVTVSAALTEYLSRCGYAPLCTALSAAEMVRRWLRQHPGSEVTWDDVWSWAIQAGTPLAEYHAVTIALHIPSTRPSRQMDAFWHAVLGVLDLHAQDDTTGTSVNVWRMYGSLATHYLRHLESLYPAQDGERAACYAWWLVAQVADMVGKGTAISKAALAQAIQLDSNVSSLHWALARSPVVPSALRYVTLCTNGVWGISLLVQLSETLSSLAFEDMPGDVQDRLHAVLPEYLLTCPCIADDNSHDALLGFQETSRLVDLCTADELVKPGHREMLQALLPLRREIATAEGLRTRLDQLQALPVYEQRLTMMALREAVLSTEAFDGIISEWLMNTAEVVTQLESVGASELELLLEAVAEFQQHQQNDWRVRLPHALAYAIERLDDPERVKLVHTHVMLMSINAGIASPIQRTASSKWRPELLRDLKSWRDSIVEAAKHCEPWVTARVRAASAAISRIVGPRSYDSVIEREEKVTATNSGEDREDQRDSGG